MTKSDEELAAACRHALAVHRLVPHLQIRVSVADGWVQLAGDVAWEYQRQATVKAVKRVAGVVGITDGIEIKTPLSPSEIRDRIAAAFKHTAEVDANGITIEARDGKVVLGGTVRSQAEKEQAREAATTMAGVIAVEDRLVVAP